MSTEKLSVVNAIKTCLSCSEPISSQNKCSGKLNSLKFNLFQTNNNIEYSPHNTNLDNSFNINEIYCNYYLPTEFLTQSKKHLNLTNTLCIMHLNIRSIRNKLDSLKNLNDSLNKNLDIIGLTETWLNKNDCEQYYKLEGYDYVGLNRTNKKGGGVCIYIKEQIKPQKP